MNKRITLMHLMQAAMTQTWGISTILAMLCGYFGSLALGIYILYIGVKALFIKAGQPFTIMYAWAIAVCAFGLLLTVFCVRGLPSFLHFLISSIQFIIYCKRPEINKRG